jgi:hypothetical protein
MDSLFANDGEVDEVDFAKRLYYWIRHGFPELGDLGGLGIGATVNSVVKQKDFTEKPHDSARRIWEQSNKVLAANGAVMRTSVLGIPMFWDLDKVIANTKKICLVSTKVQSR